MKSSTKGRHSFMPFFAVPRQFWEKLLSETASSYLKKMQICREIGFINSSFMKLLGFFGVIFVVILILLFPTRKKMEKYILYPTGVNNTWIKWFERRLNNLIRLVNSFSNGQNQFPWLKAKSHAWSKNKDSTAFEFFSHFRMY